MRAPVPLHSFYPPSSLLTCFISASLVSAPSNVGFSFLIFHIPLALFTTNARTLALSTIERPIPVRVGCAVHRCICIICSVSLHLNFSLLSSHILPHVLLVLTAYVLTILHPLLPPLTPLASDSSHTPPHHDSYRHLPRCSSADAPACTIVDIPPAGASCRRERL
ncbi:hypothetical protein BD311DRAFT_270076 [Dichomitus squalens]|uniref:Uncharacterized protein n=1 Tax=Dichomitus squalens TaxID=114155 RepID=A0A4Q9MQC5_9APHY|nr:hypothetical protein BD311DRAFT_270076 [Dichomitus squalens]